MPAVVDNLTPAALPPAALQFYFSLVWMLVLIGVLMTSVGACILAERKIAGFIQDRYGPNRVGPWGLFQPVADGIKFFMKEDITPANVEKPIFFLASGIAFVVALIGFAIIPWAGNVHLPWTQEGATVSTQVADINVGILYLLAVGSLGVYSTVLAGWASNNKYSFYGGMRSTAQMLSYEVPMGLAILCILLVSGDLRLGVIVGQQAQSGVWNVFMHPIAFMLLLISAFAETNRAPFDLAEAEQELVGGFHTEYSSMKFALFFLGEYLHMITVSALMVALFFGGWHFWWITPGESTHWFFALIKLGVYSTKIVLLIGFFMVVRWTLPRFRFDQLMRLAWKGMIPLGLATVCATGVLAALGWQRSWYWCLPVNVLLLAILLRFAARSRTPITGRQPNLAEIDTRPAGELSTG